MVGGKQDISIGRGCGRKGIIQHEIFHALGRLHEQSRPDRNQYVTINWHNIEPNKGKWFSIMQVLLHGNDLLFGQVSRETSGFYLQTHKIFHMIMALSCIMDPVASVNFGVIQISTPSFPNSLVYRLDKEMAFLRLTGCILKRRTAANAAKEILTEMPV